MRIAPYIVTIGQIDCGLGPESGKPDILGRDVVCLASEEAGLTREPISRGAVCLGNMAARRTGLRRVTGIYQYHRYSAARFP